MGIRLWIAILTALGLAVAVGFTSTYFVFSLNSVERATIRDRIISEAEHIREMVGTELQKQNLAEVESIARIAAEPDEISVQITDRDGVVLIDTSSGRQGQASPVAQQALRRGTRYVTPVGDYTSGAVAVNSTEGRRIGAVVVRLDTRQEQAHLSTARDIGLAAVMIGSVAGLFVAYALAAFITIPLLLLFRAIQRIAAGDYESRVRPPSIIELRAIADAFNNMAVAVTQRNRNLELMNNMAAEVTQARRFTGIADSVYRTGAVVLEGEARIWVFDKYVEKLQRIPAMGLEDGRFDAAPKSPISLAARESKLVVIGDGQTDYPSGTSFVEGLPPIKAGIMIPLKDRTMTVGVMTIDLADSHPSVSHELVSLAVAVANIVGPAVSSIRKMESRIRTSRMLQKILVPQAPKEIPGVDIAALYRPAEEIGRLGGDFYEFIQLSEDNWCIALGDVSGKGLHAAQYAAMTKFVLRSYVLEYQETLPAIRLINSVVLKQTNAEWFITLFYAIINTSNRRFRYVRAGHPPPMLYQKNTETVKLLKALGMPTGIMEDAVFEEAEEQLFPDDVLVMYTDGVTEARQGADLYGEERLSGVIIDCAGLNADQIANRIIREVTEFAGGRLTDDAAVVVLKIRQGNL